MGIYKITNLVNNKVYIGSAKNVEYRINVHLSKLKGGYHINKHLQAAFSKYGESNFKFELIRETSVGILRRAEQFYINKYQSINPKYGYNKAVVISNAWDDLEDLPVKKDKLYFGCYDKQGKLVKVFKTIDEVFIFLGGRYTRVYQAVTSNLTLTANNYYWIRLDVNKHKFENKIKVGFRKGRHKKIRQYDMNNNFMAEWESAVQAAAVLKLSSFNITRCLKKNNIYKNYKWFYSAP